MANKSDLFVGNKPVGHVSRNGFDNSQDLIFSMRPSVARPVYFLETVPDSAHKIDAVDLVRTDSLQTAAFLRGKQELDFFFVPYSLLDSQANNIILTRGDTVNPVLTSRNAFHSVSLPWLVEMASLPYIFYRFALELNVNNAGLDFEKVFLFFNEYCFVAPQQTDEQSLSFLLNSFVYDFSYQGVILTDVSFIGSDSLSLLSSLGYGDYYFYVKLFMDTYFSLYPVGDVSGDYGTWFRHCRIDFQNYLSTIFNGGYSNDFRGTVSSGRYVSLLSLAAYQKIFFDFYRDSVNDDSEVYHYASSLDWLQDNYTQIYPFSSSDPNGIVPDNNNILLTYLRPHTRMYKKDLSCGLYSSTQYGVYGTTNVPKTDFVATEAGANSNISAASMKFAFALQRYRQMLLRAGSRTKDVLRAEFGVRSQYVDEHYCRYLGSFQGSIDVNRVSATAESGDYSVGDIAGNVFSSLQGKTIDFTCNDYGIIIGVLSFLSDPVHSGFGIDTSVLRTSTEDFFHPEFDNLGLMPVSSDSFSPLVYDSDGVRSQPFVLGFAPRDISYKQKFDKALDNFAPRPILPLDLEQTYVGEIGSVPDGSFSNYVITKPVSKDVSLLRRRIYQLPNQMDNIFTTLDGGDPDYHHFRVCLSVHCTSVNPMSVIGLI